MSFGQTLSRSFHDCRGLIGTAAFLLASVIVASFCMGGRFSDLTFVLPSLALSIAFVVGAFTLVFLGLYPVALWSEYRAKTLTIKNVRVKVDAWAAHYFDSGRFTEGLPLFLAILLMIFIIPFMKSMIQYIHPYGIDPLLEHWDTVLHGGMNPQEWIAPIIEKTGFVSVLNITYNLWFPVMLGAYWYAAFLDGDRCRRMLFLWASLLGWVILGGILATLASSVGPLFYGDFISGNNPYESYIAHLVEVNKTHTLLSLSVAAILLDMSKDSSIIDANGISAMPSMHLAVATLVTLYAFDCRKLMGVFAALFLLLILTGSIYLGWHYAIDGYAGILGAGLIYSAIKYLGRSEEHD